LLPGVEAELRGLGASFRVERTTSMDHARELARGARDAGELVAAMGGGGLAGGVAGELAGGSGLLAVLPGGRGNDFARKLGIPPDPVAACGLLAEGRERRIDLAQTGGRSYLGILSAGFDSDVNAIANSTRLPLGEAVYVYAAVRALARWRPARWEVSVDGERRAFTGYSVAVANSGVYGGGMKLVPDAALDDGRLDVVLCEQIPKPRALLLFAKVFKGAHVGDPGLTFLRAEQIEFSADRPFTAYADGDPICPLPATVRVLPAALRVVAPA
jgi:YegS/Rv2252/BmrU family lipid kinase